MKFRDGIGGAINQTGNGDPPPRPPKRKDPDQTDSTTPPVDPIEPVK